MDAPKPEKPGEASVHGSTLIQVLGIHLVNPEGGVKKEGVKGSRGQGVKGTDDGYGMRDAGSKDLDARYRIHAAG
jgi:hypothetical protein